MVEEQTYDPASHYDRVTDAWALVLGDDLHFGLFRGGERLEQATEALSQAMVDAAGLTPGVAVLDVGCGTGNPACQLVEQHGAHVLGISTSEVGVRRARERAASRGLSDRASFEVRDGTATGLPDESFDRVWVLESSHLMRDRPGLVAECARVLRPGGRVALCDLMLGRPMPFHEVRRLREPLGVLRRVFGDARMMELSDYVQMFETEGMVIDQRDDLSELARPTLGVWRANLDANEAELSLRLGEAGLAEFRTACDVMESFWSDGTLGYGLVAARKP
jgi:27-O-demethylrifamycin SV methyltransferase